jgi:hypothetical protein
LHVVFAPTLQAEPDAVGGFEGTPAVHTSLVQALPSTGTSVLSATATIAPAPLHWFFWQLLAVCADVGVPLAVKAKPQVLATQVRVWHSVSWPGHVDAVTHWTHCPVPLHVVPPFWLQAEPDAVGGFDGAPAVHTSLVHWRLSTGRSVLSATGTITPAPSHWFFLQSAAVCAATAVPAAVNEKPQTFAVHVRVLHSSSTPGHVAAATQPTQLPAASQT